MLHLAPRSVPPDGKEPLVQYVLALLAKAHDAEEAETVLADELQACKWTGAACACCLLPSADLPLDSSWEPD